MVSSNERKSQAEWFLNALLVVLALVLSSSSSAFAACHTVTPSGSGSKTGADWNNAYAGIPSTLVRGDVYYLADGSYPAYTFSTGGSGTTTIEIRKAQSYDNCTSTGWNTSTMGSSQARFVGDPALSVNGPYFTMNGNGNTKASGCGGGPGTTVASEPPTPSDCGIALVGSGNQNSGATNVVGIHASNLTLNYIELVGSGYNAGDLEIFGSGGGYLTITHMYGRNSGCVYVQDVGTNSTIDHSYFWGTEVYGAPEDVTAKLNLRKVEPTTVFVATTSTGTSLEQRFGLSQPERVPTTTGNFITMWCSTRSRKTLLAGLLTPFWIALTRGLCAQTLLLCKTRSSTAFPMESLVLPLAGLCSRTATVALWLRTTSGTRIHQAALVFVAAEPQSPKTTIPSLITA